MEENITVKKILDNEQLKDLADKIVSEDIDNIILIYRGKSQNSIKWATTVKDWAMVFGSMAMIHQLMQEEWMNEDSEE